MPLAIPWMIENAHWIIPSLIALYSDIRGWKNGGKDATFSGHLVDLIVKILSLIKR